MEQQEEPLDENQKKKLQSSYENIPLPPAMEFKTIQQLYDKQLLRHKTRPVWMRIAFFIVFAGLFFLAGILTGKNSPTKKNTLMAQNEKKQYMLLLHNTPEFKESTEHAKEYGDWMRGLTTKGTIATGNELAADGWLLNASNANGDKKIFPVSGYFIIETTTDEIAMEIAKTCPHIRHKGHVELRPIIQH